MKSPATHDAREVASRPGFLYITRGIVADVRRDLRVAFRGLLRSPAFFLTGLITFGAASAVVASIFTVIKLVLLERLPVIDEDRIVVAWKEDVATDSAQWPFSYPSVRALAEQLTTVSDLATVDYNGAYPLTMVKGD